MFHAEIELTNHCNTRCVHCPHETISRPRGRMERATFEAIVEKIRAHAKGARFSLSFSGMGEPLLHPEIFDFVRLVAHEARTSFATNAAALNEANVNRLMEAGLDTLYVSFSGDTPELFATMSGGLSFARVRENLRKAVALTAGRRLKVNANVSVTKLNRERVAAIRTLLEADGVNAITYSLCHSRGGNLRDADVVDTPAQPEPGGHCDVLANTLFVDWRGKVLLCDHDLHGEYGYGDLVTESLATILARREAMLAAGLAFSICRDCRDLLKTGFRPLASEAGGRLPEWIHDLYAESPEKFTHATASFRWLYAVAEQQGRIPRLVDKLLSIESNLQRELSGRRDDIEHWRESDAAKQKQLDRVAERIEHLELVLADRDGEIAGLNRTLQDELARKDHWIGELNRRIENLDRRLQLVRRSRTWRFRRSLLRLLGQRESLE